MTPATIERVRHRAGNRCEYCRMHQLLQGATFHVEHIRPASKGGNSDDANLAWCCPSCNLHKADRTEAVDPLTGLAASLFDPRCSAWNDHFEWDGYRLSGKTPSGRTTTELLRLNGPRRVLIRQAEEKFGLFPPNA